MLVAELSFVQTIGAGVISAVASALFTAGFVGIVAARFIHRIETRDADRRHREGLSHQTRAVLRDAYAQLLVAQRRTREASLRLARAQGAARVEADLEVVNAYAQFIDQYHRVSLDASKELWRDLRKLRRVLGAMKRAARRADVERCDELFELARDARQNLEDTFRIELGHERLHARRNPLGRYDNVRDEDRLVDERDLVS
ncbi:MAG: hypothetical protein ABI140_05185 [Jatrophihabitantaceae bacterium]